MPDRISVARRCAAALLCAGAALALLAAPARAAKGAPTTSQVLARVAADIDALLADLALRFPNAAAATDQAGEQASLAEGYLKTARKSIADLGPTLDPKFEAIPRRAASNPLADALKAVDGLSTQAEAQPSEPWALQVISVQQDLHTAEGFIDAGKLIPSPSPLGSTGPMSPSPGNRRHP
jgi:hypothetical protein